MNSRIVLLAAVLVAACSESATAPRAVTKAPSRPGPSAPSFDVIAGSQLVTNGSFESPVIPADNSVPWQTYNSISQGIPGWTVASGSVDIQSGEPGAPFTGVPSGSQVLDLNNASITQSVATTAGVTYRVVFSLSENYAVLGGAPVTVSVSFGATTQSYTFSGNAGESAQNMRWDSHSFDVTASGSSTTLQFTGGAGSNGAGGPMLDNIQVQSPSTYTSGSNVTAYDPLPGGTDTNWGVDVCTTTPAISLDDPRWKNPHAAYVLTGHPWANNYFFAPWINAWNDIGESVLPSLYPTAGFVHPTSGSGDYYNWTKYTTTISGQGNYVIQLLADNCSWIYLNDQLVGVQGTDLAKNTYAVNLNGSETLTFLIFDGGGAAGGKFLLQTYQSYVAAGGNPSFVLPTPTPNGAPTIAAQNAALAVDEGTTATNTGTVSDPDNDAVTLTASVGTVTNNGNGTWSWSYATTDGTAQSQTVTITADDGHSHQVSTNFALTVNNVAPSVTAAPAATVNIGDTYTLHATFTDAGTQDTPWTVTINWGDGSSAQTVSASTMSFSATHTYTKFGSYTASYTVTDKDGAVSAPATTTVQVNDPTPPVIVPTVAGTLGTSGWYTSNVNVSWSVTDPESPITAQTGCTAVSISTDTNGQTITCSATSAGGTASHSVTIKRDHTLPTVTYTGNAGSYTVDQTVAITCSAADATSPGSGLASSTCQNIGGAAYTFAIGNNSFSATAIDNAGNTGAGSTSFTVKVTYGGVCALTRLWVTQPGKGDDHGDDDHGNAGDGHGEDGGGIAHSLCEKLQHAQEAAARGKTKEAAEQVKAYIHEVTAQSGKAIAADKAAILIALANKL